MLIGKAFIDLDFLSIWPTFKLNWYFSETAFESTVFKSSIEIFFEHHDRNLGSNDIAKYVLFIWVNVPRQTQTATTSPLSRRCVTDTVSDV